MHSTIAIAGKSVVVGLNWTVVAKAGPGRKKDVKKACLDSGFTFGVQVEGPELAAIGLCPKKMDLPSGAAILAAANASVLKGKAFGDTQNGANWILVEPVKSGDKSGSYWMCAVSEGVPVPGTDIIEDYGVISAKLAELVEVLENVEIYSTVQDVLDYVAEVSPAYPKGFADLTAEVSASKLHKPQKVVGIPDWVFMLGFGVGLAILAALAGYTLYEQHQEEVRRQALQKQKAEMAAKAAEEARKNDQVYRQKDDEARMAEIKKIEESLGNTPANVLKVWARVVNSVALNQGGWGIERLTCDKASCVVSLVRDETLGTNASLREMHANAEFTEAGTATYNLPVAFPAGRPANVGNLKDWAQFALTVVSGLQELKMSGYVDTSFGVKKELTYRPPAFPAPAGVGGKVVQGKSNDQPPPPRPLGIMSGVVTLKGTSVWQLDDVADYLGNGEFSLDSLVVEFGRNLSADASWVLKGSYYVKSTGEASRTVPVAAGAAGGAVPSPPSNQPLPVVSAERK